MATRTVEPKKGTELIVVLIILPVPCSTAVDGFHALFDCAKRMLDASGKFQFEMLKVQRKIKGEPRTRSIK
jgi:hypothetical protein